MNLSISTVSRALRNVGEVGEETRRRVKELADSWKYRPDPLALGLLKNKTGSVGVIMPDPVNYYYATILSGLNTIAAEKGYHLFTYYSSDHSFAEQKAIDDFLWARAEGIVICPALDTVDLRHYQKIIDSGVPLVLVERMIPASEIPAVVTDNYKSTVNLLEYLIGSGRRRIALISSLEYISVGRTCYEAYLDVLRKHRIAVRKDLIVYGNLNISTSIEAARNLLQSDPRPDAVFVTDDSSAMAVMHFIQSAGLQIPRNIAVIGFNDEPFSSFLEPPLTTVSRPGYLLGMRAMELLFDILGGKAPLSGARKIVLESDIIIKGSSG